jgi:membrane protease YdiL (CAAX protease family)
VLLHKIFINEFGRLRSGWRVVLFVFALFAISFLLVTALRAVYFGLQSVTRIPNARFTAEVVYRLGSLAAVLAAGYICARFLEDLPWRSLGLTLHDGWLRDLLVGSLVGIGSLAFAVGIATIAGGLRFSISSRALMGAVFSALIDSAVLLFVAALAEEAIFRGYPLQTLTRARLAWVGVLLTSLPFALVHLRNPNVVPVVTFTNTALAGLWLAVAYLRTRSLWLPLGVHWGWNWALGWLFGLPISGITLVSNPLLRGNDLGPAWLTGGSYGIEGGVACTIALAVFTLFLWRTRWVSATPELMKLTSEENPAKPSPVVTILPSDLPGDLPSDDHA